MQDAEETIESLLSYLLVQDAQVVLSFFLRGRHLYSVFRDLVGAGVCARIEGWRGLMLSQKTFSAVDGLEEEKAIVQVKTGQAKVVSLTVVENYDQ